MIFHIDPKTHYKYLLFSCIYFPGVGILTFANDMQISNSLFILISKYHLIILPISLNYL